MICRIDIDSMIPFLVTLPFVSCNLYKYTRLPPSSIIDRLTHLWFCFNIPHNQFPLGHLAPTPTRSVPKLVPLDPLDAIHPDLEQIPPLRVLFVQIGLVLARRRHDEQVFHIVACDKSNKSDYNSSARQHPE